MPTSAGHLADGKTVGSEVWEQRRDTQGQRAHPEALVPSPSQKHGPRCQKQGTEAMLVAVHTLRQHRHKNKTLPSTFPLWGDGRNRTVVPGHGGDDLGHDFATLERGTQEQLKFGPKYTAKHSECRKCPLHRQTWHRCRESKTQNFTPFGVELEACRLSCLDN